MKIEEVIEHLNDINTIARTRHMGRLMDGELEDGEIQVYRDRFEAVKMAVSALEKQTQKEPELIMIGLHNTEIAIYGKMNNIEISTKLQINYRLQKNL